MFIPIFTGFLYIPGGMNPDFWTINSITSPFWKTSMKSWIFHIYNPQVMQVSNLGNILQQKQPDLDHVSFKVDTYSFTPPGQTSYHINPAS